MLKYNISSNSEPDSRRVTIIVASSLFVMILFTTLGFLIQSRDRAEIIKNNDKLEALSLKIENTTSKVGDYTKIISENRDVYGKEIDYTNKLIARSSVPFISMLDKVEDLLPLMVSVRSLTYGIKRKGDLSITLESETMPPLIEVFEKLPSQKLVISEPNEKRNENYFTATIVIGGANEKK